MAVYHLNTPLSKEDVCQLNGGDTVYLSGEIFTGRSRIHRYIFDENNVMPVDTASRNAMVHVGPIVTVDENGSANTIADLIKDGYVCTVNGEIVIAKGTCGRVGSDMGEFEIKTEKGKFEKEVAMPDHTAAFLVVKEALTSGETKVIDSLDEISAIGHRVVQGGAIYKESTLITDEVINGIKGLCDLAPLHNPAHIQGINACMDVFGKDVPEVAVFDNAFHSTMPDYAYRYALPKEAYTELKVRKYGFSEWYKPFWWAEAEALYCSCYCQKSKILYV